MAQFIPVVPDEFHFARHLSQIRNAVVLNTNLEGLDVLHVVSVPQP